MATDRRYSLFTGDSKAELLRRVKASKAGPDGKVSAEVVAADVVG